MDTNILIQFLTQYGLAGCVIYLFYKIIENHFKTLGNKIDNLSEKIEKLILLIEERTK